MNINPEKLTDENLFYLTIEYGIGMTDLLDEIVFYKSDSDLITDSESYVGSFMSYDTDKIHNITNIHALARFEEAIKSLGKFAETARKEKKHIISLQIGVDCVSVQVANRQKCLDALRNAQSQVNEQPKIQNIDEVFALSFIESGYSKEKKTFIGIFETHDAAMLGFLNWIQRTPRIGFERERSVLVNTLYSCQKERRDYSHLSPECQPAVLDVREERENIINSTLKQFNHLFGSETVFIEIKPRKLNQVIVGNS